MPQAIAAINRCSLRAKQVLFSRAGSTETRSAAPLNAAKLVQIRRVPATPERVSAASGSGKTPMIFQDIEGTIRDTRETQSLYQTL